MVESNERVEATSEDFVNFDRLQRCNWDEKADSFVNLICIYGVASVQRES